jgi:hypothetical protein
MADGDQYHPGPLGPPPKYGESRVGWVPEQQAPPPIDWDAYRAAQMRPVGTKVLAGKNTRTAGWIVLVISVGSIAIYGVLRDALATEDADMTAFTVGYFTMLGLQFLLGVGLVMRIPWVRILAMVLFGFQIVLSIAIMAAGVGFGSFLIPAIILWLLFTDRPESEYPF